MFLFSTIHNFPKFLAATPRALFRLHNLYEAIRGNYLGQYKVGKEGFTIRFSIEPTLGRYEGRRIRTISEVENDLLNLKLTIRETTSSQTDPDLTFGCLFTDAKVIAARGQIVLVSEDCKQSFDIYLRLTDSTKVPIDSESAEAAKQATNGQIQNLENIVVLQRSVFKDTENKVFLKKSNL